MASWTVRAPRRLELAQEIGRLEVNLVSGRLTVVGTDGPARIEIDRASPDLPIEVRTEDDRLFIGSAGVRPWPGPLAPLWWWLIGGRKTVSDVSVAVPAGCSAVLRVTSGTVVASNLGGDLSAHVVSGRVALLGAAGRVRGQVIAGPIEAIGCTAEVLVETVSGEITVADSATARLRAKTISGAVTVDLDNPPEGGDIRLETSSGEITVRVREDSDLAVHLTTAHGRITSAFPQLPGTTGRRATVDGVLGAGGGTLRAAAIGGNITLLCRPVDADFAAGEPR